MSDLLTDLAGLALGAAEGIRPLARPRFAPPIADPAGDPSRAGQRDAHRRGMVGSEAGEGQEEEITVQTEAPSEVPSHRPTRPAIDLPPPTEIGNRYAPPLSPHPRPVALSQRLEQIAAPMPSAPADALPISRSEDTTPAPVPAAGIRRATFAEEIARPSVHPAAVTPVSRAAADTDDSAGPKSKRSSSAPARRSNVEEAAEPSRRPLPPVPRPHPTLEMPPARPLDARAAPDAAQQGPPAVRPRTAETPPAKNWPRVCRKQPRNPPSRNRRCLRLSRSFP